MLKNNIKQNKMWQTKSNKRSKKRNGNEQKYEWNKLKENDHMMVQFNQKNMSNAMLPFTALVVL